MWIFSTIGFFSLTESRVEKGKMQFRGRERVDLENLCRKWKWPLAAILETPEADYRYRVTVTRATAVQVVMELAEEIDYSNFKNAVHDNPTQHRKGPAYMRVWSTMNELQPRRDPWAGHPDFFESGNLGRANRELQIDRAALFDQAQASRAHNAAVAKKARKSIAKKGKAAKKGGAK